MSVGILGLLGCGQQYRPVVAAINPVGPAGQPTKYAIAVSNPTSGTGLLTVVDVSGDTILATPQVTSLGSNPSPLFVTTSSGATQTFVTDGLTSLSDVPTSSPSGLLTSSVVNTTLPTATSSVSVNVPSLSAFTLGSTPRLLIPEISQSAVGVFSTVSPALQQQITVPANPVYVVGTDGTPRGYVISNGTGTGNGVVSAIEGTSLSISATIPVGVDPVYGVETTDTRRAFILNKGSGTVSVINVTNNAIDNANPVIPATGTLGLNPVWADLTAATNQLVVLNQGDGVHPGSLSIINVPLCNAAAEPANSACNSANPVDAAGFGTVLATVPVGINPTMVSVLEDGSQAYVVNSGNTTDPGGVTIVNLVTGTVTATIPAASASDLNGTPSCPSTVASAGCIYGHPQTVAATTGTPTGKVYVTSPDSIYMTIIQTDSDAVDTHVNLQGAGVRVRVSAP